MKLVLIFTSIFLIISCTKQQVDKPESKIKAPIKGLVTMGSVNDLYHGNFDVLKEAHIHRNIYSGVVIHTTWGELEPQRGVFDFSSIETALHKIKDYNNAYPNHKLGSKLRVSATINPPNWVLHLSGGPVQIVSHQPPITIEVGLFWTNDYIQAWRELQEKLAETYDLNSLINEVCITSATMATDEPFVTIYTQETIDNLHDKGFTDEAYKQALIGALDDYSYWKNTPLDYTFNIFRSIDNGYPAVGDSSFTLSVMDEFRARYGEKAVLENCGLQENLNTWIVPIYNKFLELGGPIAAQTKSPNDLTDQTFRVGLSYGISQFEIWDSAEAGGYANFNINDLIRWKEIIDNY